MLFINSFWKYAFFRMQIDIWRKMIIFWKKKTSFIESPFHRWRQCELHAEISKKIYGIVTCLWLFFSATIKFIYEFCGCRDHHRESTIWPLVQSWWPKMYQRFYPLVFHPNSTLLILLKNLASRNFTVSQSKSHFPPSPIETLPTEKNLRTFFQ